MFELIVVDGYSTDSTLNIVSEAIHRLRSKFSHQFIRDIIIQERIGVGYARNLALKEAQGNWILWLDSDNILSPDYVSKAYERIKSLSKDVAVIYPERVIPLYSVRSLAQRALMHYLLCSKIKTTTYSKFIRGIKYTAMQGTLCRTEHLHEIGGFNILLPAAEDIDVFIRLVNKGYTMKSFSSTLYFFVRSNLKLWFKQAMYWGYGQYLLSYLHQESVLETRDPDLYRKVSVASIKALKNSLKMMSYATQISKDVPSIVLIPLLYIYRRLGYLIGWKYAQKHIRNVLLYHNQIAPNYDIKGVS